MADRSVTKFGLLPHRISDQSPLYNAV